MITCSIINIIFCTVNCTLSAAKYLISFNRPKDETKRLKKEIRVYDLLDSLDIEYQRVDHGLPVRESIRFMIKSSSKIIPTRAFLWDALKFHPKICHKVQRQR